MKPRSKIDKWCYTLTDSVSRNKAKRIVNKAHRRNDKQIIADSVEEYLNDEQF